MFAVPTETPITSPVLDTVAIPGADELHVPPETVDEYIVEKPIQISVGVPLKTPALGIADTTTALSTVAGKHPPVPETVYRICAVPAVTPVITPLAFTLAIPGLRDDHVPPDTDDVYVVVLPIQIAVGVPLSDPALGGDVTLTVNGVALTAAHPPVPCTE